MAISTSLGDGSAFNAGSAVEAPVLERDSRPRHLPHLPALDGLRGLAVIGVLLFHAGHLKGGFLGVDLFFTLSGFLITSLLLTEHARTERIGLGAFWGRRARRLLPAVLTLFVVMAGYTAIWGKPSDFPGVRRDGIAALFYVANWRSIISGNGYWDQYKPKSPFDHLWSLAIEEQFYVVWPVVVAFLLWRFQGRLRPLATFTVAAMWASVLAMVVMHRQGDDPNRVYMGTDTRVSSILAGVIVALAVARFPKRMGAQDSRNEIIGGAALVAIVWSWFVIDGVKAEWLYEGGLFVHAVLTAVVITVVFGRREGVLARVLSLRPLRWAGKVSYGLYLWHWPVYWVMNPFRMGYSGWGLTIVRLLVSAVLATLSFRMVETPIRKGAIRTSLAKLLVPAVVLVCVWALVLSTVAPSAPTAVAAPVSTIASTTTTPTTTPTTTTAPAPVTDATGSSLPAAATTATPTTVAPTTTAGAPRPASLLVTTPADLTTGLAKLRRPTAAEPLRVLLLGDSFMFDASPGIAQALSATGAVTVVDASFQGFALTRPAWRELWGSMVANNRPELVIALWGTFDSPTFNSSPEPYRLLFDEAMGVLMSGGASVALIGVPPSISGGGVNVTKVDRSINTLFREQPNRFAGRVVFVDSDPIVAPKGTAELSIDTPTGKQRVRKIDLHHFCSEGSARFGDAMLDLVNVVGVPTPPAAAWRDQLWRFDKRYNEPAGACQ
jgi:peptidoglycan/LPS O-acetylase OafA/YrhL